MDLHSRIRAAAKRSEPEGGKTDDGGFGHQSRRKGGFRGSATDQGALRIFLILASFGLLGTLTAVVRPEPRRAPPPSSPSRRRGQRDLRGQTVHMTGTATRAMSSPSRLRNLPHRPSPRTHRPDVLVAGGRSRARRRNSAAERRRRRPTPTRRNGPPPCLFRLQKREGMTTPAAMRYETNSLTASKVDIGAHLSQPHRQDFYSSLRRDGRKSCGASRKPS